MDNTMWYVMGGVTLVLAGIGAWMWWKHEQEKELNTLIQAFSNATNPSSSSSVFGSTSGAVGITGTFPLPSSPDPSTTSTTRVTTSSTPTSSSLSVSTTNVGGASTDGVAVGAPLSVT